MCIRDRPQSVASLPYFLLLVLVGALFYFGPGLALKAFDLAAFLGLLRRRKRG